MHVCSSKWKVEFQSLPPFTGFLCLYFLPLSPMKLSVSQLRLSLPTRCLVPAMEDPGHSQVTLKHNVDFNVTLDAANAHCCDRRYRSCLLRRYINQSSHIMIARGCWEVGLGMFAPGKDIPINNCNRPCPVDTGRSRANEIFRLIGHK